MALLPEVRHRSQDWWPCSQKYGIEARTGGKVARAGGTEVRTGGNVDRTSGPVTRTTA